MAMQQVRDLSSIKLRDLERIRRHAEAALAHSGGTHDWADVLALLIAGKLQLWVARRSMMMTELVEYPKLTACRIFLAGGELEELIGMADALADEAAAIGVERLEVMGRPGWAKVGERIGWTAQSFCTRDIGHG
jgi:hypothetical protein